MNNLNSIGETIIGIMSVLATVIITLAIISFMFGLLNYIISESPDKKEKAKKYIVNGVIILTVMVSIWGILELIRYTFINNLGNIDISSNPTTETIDILKIQ